MNKKNSYKVFLSSTYLDLTDVRHEVINNILKLGHHPIAMEYFGPRAQLPVEVIMSKMDECQFYVLIISGKYGSELDGKSYTELEFEYATKKGMPIIAVIPQDINRLPAKYKETNPSKLKKLAALIKSVKSVSTIEFWNTYAEIPTLIIAGLTNEIKEFDGTHQYLTYRKASEYLLSLNDILGIGNGFDKMVKKSKSIFILGRMALSIVKAHRDVLTKELNKGCQLKIAVLNPRSKVTNYIYGVNHSNFAKKFIHLTKNLKKIDRDLQANRKGNVLLKTNRNPPRSSILIVVREKPCESFAIVQLDIRSTEFASRPLVCVNCCDPLYITLLDDFTTYWDDSNSKLNNL